MSSGRRGGEIGRPRHAPRNGCWHHFQTLQALGNVACPLYLVSEEPGHPVFLSTALPSVQGEEARVDGVYAQATHHSQRDAEVPNTVAGDRVSAGLIFKTVADPDRPLLFLVPACGYCFYGRDRIGDSFLREQCLVIFPLKFFG